jgi:hypothetical protein
VEDRDSGKGINGEKEKRPWEKVKEDLGWGEVQGE